jgi:hypothetical protein
MSKLNKGIRWDDEAEFHISDDQSEPGVVSQQPL